MSEIILPETIEYKETVEKELKKLDMEFTSRFNLSYMDFCNANGLSDVNDTIIDKWVCETVNSYQNDAPVEALKEFFKVPDTRINILRNKHFKVTAEGIINNSKEKVITINLRLMLLPESALE